MGIEIEFGSGRTVKRYTFIIYIINKKIETKFYGGVL